jgi:hypothetical protein
LNAEDIMQVLRLTAMGRVGHPEQQRLCDALAKLMETPEEYYEAVPLNPGIANGPAVAVKRTRKKAD